MSLLSLALLGSPFVARDQIWKREHAVADPLISVAETHQNHAHWTKLGRVPAIATHEVHDGASNSRPSHHAVCAHCRGVPLSLLTSRARFLVNVDRPGG